MKFNKKKLLTYKTRIVSDAMDGLAYDIASQVKAFIDDVSQNIDKDGYKCDEYHILYIPAFYDDRINVWFNLYPNNHGILVVGIPKEFSNKSTRYMISNAIEEALKEENENDQ